MLQEGIPGYVISTSSRFHAVAEWVAHSDSSSSGVETDAVAVQVISPQFHDSWHYSLPFTTPLLLHPTQAKSDGSVKRNPYVENAVEVALCATSARNGADALLTALRSKAAARQTLRVTVAADNEFYSQRQALTERGLRVSRESLASLPPRNACPVDAATGRAIVSKTGLGSSAALVTSLTAALLALLCPPGSEEIDRGLVHTCAQVAHGLAQGKIGSGFDVCSAVYGSIAFTRVPPTALGAAMDAYAAVREVTGGEGGYAAVREVTGGEGGYAAVGATLLALDPPPPPPPALPPALSPSTPATGLQHKLDTARCAWAYSATPFCLPPGLALALADVAGGSETPGMVRIILAWRDAQNSAGERDEGDRAVPGVAAVLDAAVASLFPAGLPREGQGEGEDGAPVHAAYRSARGPVLWRLLAAANARVAVALAALEDIARKAGAQEGVDSSSASARAYYATLRAAARDEQGEGAVAPSIHAALAHIRAAFATSRALLRAMGEAAGTPVEPAPQTALADATLTAGRGGVLAAGVPGAGGYDALFAVLIDVPAEGEGGGRLSPVRAAVEACWLGWPGGGLTPLLLRDGPGRGQPQAGLAVKVVRTEGHSS